MERNDVDVRKRRRRAAQHQQVGEDVRRHRVEHKSQQDAKREARLLILGQPTAVHLVRDVAPERIAPRERPRVRCPRVERQQREQTILHMNRESRSDSRLS